MPRFDFRCSECSYTFEQELPFGTQELPSCPQCGGKTQKLIVPPAIHFKGNGFYKTDSTTAPKAPEPEGEKEEKPQKNEKSEKKTAQKSTKEEKK